MQGMFIVDDAGVQFLPVRRGEMMVTLEDYQNRVPTKYAVMHIRKRLPDHVVCDGRVYSFAGTWDENPRPERARRSYYLQPEDKVLPDDAYVHTVPEVDTGRPDEKVVFGIDLMEVLRKSAQRPC